MKNVFFVHTPLQFMVAQQIVREFNLVNNILLYGSVGENKKIIEVYKLMSIDDFWETSIFIKDLHCWGDVRKRHIFYDFYRVLKGVNFLKKNFLKDNPIFYLGDINNNTHRFISVLFNKKYDIPIRFYEDGSSHYSYANHIYTYPLVNKFLGLFSDLFFYKPFWGMSWGKYAFCEDIPLNQIPIDRRYSLIPFYNESFDRLLHYKPLLSSRMTCYLEKELSEIHNKDSILLLTSNIYAVARTTSNSYLRVVNRFLHTVSQSQFVVIKFHPHEKDDDKEVILNNIKECGLQYKILSSKYPIPVEIYLNYIHFKKIVTFFTSTSYYNGYLFPKCEFLYLLSDYYDECVKDKEPYSNAIMDLLAIQRNQFK